MAGRRGRELATDTSSWYQNTIQPIARPSTPINAFDTFCDNLSTKFNLNPNEKLLPFKGTEFDVLQSSDYNKIQDFLVGGPQMVSDELKSLMDYKRAKISEMQQKEEESKKVAEEANKKLIEQRLTPMQNRKRR